MSEVYTHQLLKVVVAQICQTIGWHSVQSTPLELLIDILDQYLKNITRLTHRYTELYNRTNPNLDDVGLAYREIGMNLNELQEYLQFVDPIERPFEVPKFPLPKESHLNFLKPGSKEVLTRPVHIPEHMPPMLIDPEEERAEAIRRQALPLPINMEEETVTEVKPDLGEFIEKIEEVGAEEIAPMETSHNEDEMMPFKRPPDIVVTGSIDTSPEAKKVRALTEEGRPTREISSVIMTTSGFISPAREGKLPDSKPPVIPEERPKPPPPPPPPVVPVLPVAKIDEKFTGKKTRKKPVEKEKKKEKKVDKKKDATEKVSTKRPVTPAVLPPAALDPAVMEPPTTSICEDIKPLLPPPEDIKPFSFKPPTPAPEVKPPEPLLPSPEQPKPPPPPPPAVPVTATGKPKKERQKRKKQQQPPQVPAPLIPLSIPPMPTQFPSLQQSHQDSKDKSILPPMLMNPPLEVGELFSNQTFPQPSPLQPVMNPPTGGRKKPAKPKRPKLTKKEIQRQYLEQLQQQFQPSLNVQSLMEMFPPGKKGIPGLIAPSTLPQLPRQPPPVQQQKLKFPENSAQAQLDILQKLHPSLEITPAPGPSNVSMLHPTTPEKHKLNIFKKVPKKEASPGATMQGPIIVIDDDKSPPHQPQFPITPMGKKRQSKASSSGLSFQDTLSSPDLSFGMNMTPGDPFGGGIGSSPFREFSPPKTPSTIPKTPDIKLSMSSGSSTSWISDPGKLSNSGPGPIFGDFQNFGLTPLPPKEEKKKRQRTKQPKESPASKKAKNARLLEDLTILQQLQKQQQAQQQMPSVPTALDKKSLPDAIASYSKLLNQPIPPALYSNQVRNRMFSMFPLPSGPGLIPENPLFNPFPGQPSFLPFGMPAMRPRFDVSNLLRYPRPPKSTQSVETFDNLDPETKLAHTPLDLQKSNCNVAPLVPPSLQIDPIPSGRKRQSSAVKDVSAMSHPTPPQEQSLNLCTKQPSAASKLNPHLPPAMAAQNVPARPQSVPPEIIRQQQQQQQQHHQQQQQQHHQQAQQQQQPPPPVMPILPPPPPQQPPPPPLPVQQQQHQFSEKLDLLQHPPPVVIPPATTMVPAPSPASIQLAATAPTVPPITPGETIVIGSDSDTNSQSTVTMGAMGIGPASKKDKSEKRKNKEHKKDRKLKETKEGKVKKKKDKKDKNKSKDRDRERPKSSHSLHPEGLETTPEPSCTASTEEVGILEQIRRKEKKEKKKEKLKKEKRKEKERAAAAALESSFSDQRSSFGSAISAASAGGTPGGAGGMLPGATEQRDTPDGGGGPIASVPKLMLKFSSNTTPSPRPATPDNHAAAESTAAAKEHSEHKREVSPELARISALVTRPPKLKTPSHKSKIKEEDAGSKSSKGADHSSKAAGKLDFSGAEQPAKPRPRGIQPLPDSINLFAVTPTHNPSTSQPKASPHVPSSSAGTGGDTASHGSKKPAKEPKSSKSHSSSASASLGVTIPAPLNTPINMKDADGNVVWICPACGRVDDGTPMIGCDGCDAWYHWVCVGIQVPPDSSEDWYCRVCIGKKQESQGDEKQRRRKKKDKKNTKE